MLQCRDILGSLDILDMLGYWGSWHPTHEIVKNLPRRKNLCVHKIYTKEFLSPFRLSVALHSRAWGTLCMLASATAYTLGQLELERLLYHYNDVDTRTGGTASRRWERPLHYGPESKRLKHSGAKGHVHGQAK